MVEITQEGRLLFQREQAYRQKQYHVVTNVTRADLAPLGLTLPIDMLAYNEHETVAVEITTPQKRAQFPHYLTQLRQAIAAMPHWRADVTVITDSSQRDTYLIEWPRLSYPTIKTGLQSAYPLLATNDAQAAFDWAWDYGLAAIGYALENDEDFKPIPPNQRYRDNILALLIHEGYLHQSDLTPLEQAFNYRYLAIGEVSVELVTQVLTAFLHITGVIENYLL